MARLECDVCACGADGANAFYAAKMVVGRRRERLTVCDHCRAAVIDAQASTMTMKTDDPDTSTAVSFTFQRFDVSGAKTRERSSIDLTARAVRALPVKVARPLGLKA